MPWHAQQDAIEEARGVMTVLLVRAPRRYHRDVQLCAHCGRTADAIAWIPSAQ